jgi:hypothetical protein
MLQLFSTVGSFQGNHCLDEVDAIYGKKNDAEAENTHQFLNAGFRRGATFLRCVGQGAAIEVKKRTPHGDHSASRGKEGPRAGPAA